jgi:hypothetical protein
MTNDANAPAIDPAELSDADLETVTGGKSRGFHESSVPNHMGGTTTSSYAWRGRRFAPWF